MLYKTYRWDLICLLLKNQIFTSDLAILMLYKPYLVRSNLFTTQKLEFYIWSGFFDALRDFSGEICTVNSQKSIFYTWSGYFDALQALSDEIWYVYYLKISFFSSDLNFLMLYETFLVRFGLFTAQKLNFYIWSDYLRLHMLLSGN